MYDLMSFIAQAMSDVDQAQSEFDGEYSEYESYCSANPGECGEPFQEPILTRGPSVLDCTFADCFGYAVTATVSLTTAAAGAAMTYMAASPALGAGAWTAATAGGFYAGAAAFAGLGIYAGYSFYTCKLDSRKAPFEAYAPLGGY